MSLGKLIKLPLAVVFFLRANHQQDHCVDEGAGRRHRRQGWYSSLFLVTLLMKLWVTVKKKMS